MAETISPPTRRDRRRLAIRTEILTAARELLLEVGPDELSLRQVARRTDFSPAALYTYFSSRDDIISALFAESFERLDVYLHRVPAGLGPAQRVIELGLAYMDFARDNPMDLRCILLATSQDLPPSSGQSLGLEAARSLGETFRKGVEMGVFSSACGLSATEMAYGTWALVHGLVAISGVDLTAVSDEVSAAPRRVLESYVRCLMAPRGDPRRGGA